HPPALSGLSLRIMRGSLVRVRRLQEELTTLRSAYAEREDLPGLRTLVEGMSVVAAEIEREIMSESRQLHRRLQDGRTSAEQAEERFRDKVGGLVNALDVVLPRVLQIARTPHGREVEALIHPVTRLVASLFRREVRSIELIFEPADDYAYQLSLVDELMRVANKLKPELRDQLDDLPQMVAISYPQHLEAETLVHVIIAHEIGHTVVDYVPKGFLSAPIVEAFDLAADEHFGRLQEKLDPELERGGQVEAGEGEDADEDDSKSRTDKAIDRLRKWYEEFACDALAVGMVGPAYAFALADLDLASNRWAQIRGGAGHDSHPGLAWRLRRVIDQARREYLPEEREDAEAWGAIRAALAELEAVIPTESDELLEVERELLDAALQNLDEGDAVEKVLGYNARYSPEDFDVDIEVVWEKLGAGIPPAERIGRRTPEPDGSRPKLERVPDRWSSSMSWASIVNGAYAHWQSGRALSSDSDAHRVLPDRHRVARDWMNFNAYVRGTIELANLHEQLTAARERLDGLNAPPEED
ncbi:MAG TPA: hypothetical protein VKC63_08345, partial [Solirubrobacterales bacterium]|nr:hypothetical protein [Solirubrobacterales bacterium]